MFLAITSLITNVAMPRKMRNYFISNARSSHRTDLDHHLQNLNITTESAAITV